MVGHHHREFDGTWATDTADGATAFGAGALDDAAGTTEALAFELQTTMTRFNEAASAPPGGTGSADAAAEQAAQDAAEQAAQDAADAVADTTASAADDAADALDWLFGG